MPFLVGTGELDDSVMTAASKSLSSFWGGELVSFSCKESPSDVISSLPVGDRLFQLKGDSAKFSSNEGSWMEALGAWRIPVILLTVTTDSGDVPGVASAYVALCHKVSIPLIGIVQLGGKWNSLERSLDGLPWCGVISNDYEKSPVGNLEINYSSMDISSVGFNLRQKFLCLDL